MSGHVRIRRASPADVELASATTHAVAASDERSSSLRTTGRVRRATRVGLRTRSVFREAVAPYESVGYVPAGPSVSGDIVYFRAL